MSSVLFNELPVQGGKKIVEIKLNAERALNALSKEMIELIHPKLDEVRHDDSVVAVILDSAGEKAFCAGGDVVKLYHAIKDDLDQRFVEDWFIAEYSMDYCIHNYPKPIICWGSGIVMGGGMGMMNGCSHRVVTETTRMAMPEVTIALYPDVAASWFFNRMHQGVGIFLGLTASHMNAADALFLGLADRYLQSDKRDEMISALQCADWGREAHDVVSDVLKALEQGSAPGSMSPSNVKQHYDAILEVTDFSNATEIETAILEKQIDDQWWQRAQNTLSHGSSLAAHVIYEQLIRCRHMSLREAFLAEMILTTRCCQEPELKEGIRALLIDKDKQPNWMFSSLEDVDQGYVNSFFDAPWQINPLQERLDKVDKA